MKEGVREVLFIESGPEPKQVMLHLFSSIAKPNACTGRDESHFEAMQKKHAGCRKVEKVMYTGRWSRKKLCLVYSFLLQNLTRVLEKRGSFLREYRKSRQWRKGVRLVYWEIGPTQDSHT